MSEVRFQREPLTSNLQNEVWHLLTAHYLEIAHFHDIPLNPDWDVYYNCQRMETLRIFTARDAGILIGYCCFFVRTNPHYSTSLQAVQDVLFVEKNKRMGLWPYKFMKWCDEQLKCEGVQVIYHHIKANRDILPIMKRLGYELVDLIYARKVK